MAKQSGNLKSHNISRWTTKIHEKSERAVVADDNDICLLKQLALHITLYIRTSISLACSSSRPNFLPE